MERGLQTSTVNGAYVQEDGEYDAAQDGAGQGADGGTRDAKTSPIDDGYDKDHRVDENQRDKHELKRYGWASIRPGWLQWLNHPSGYLVFLCAFCFVQGMTVSGTIFVVISTLEKRFNLSSFQSSWISSSYDVTAMVLIIFVSYFGERSHKPRLLGIGALVFAIGSVAFTLPHFLTDPYNAEAAEFDTCDSNRTLTDPCDSGDEELENLAQYYPVFLMSQVIHAFGACGIYNLGLTHIDENLPPGKSAIYTGIFWALAILGPSAGFLTGGIYLDIYTDFYVDPTITPQSPLWIGAWWLAFLVSASLAVLVAIPLMGFNKRLPGYAEAQKQRRNETREGSSFSADNKISDFPKALLTLLKNPTYVFLNCGLVCESFLVAFTSVFGPKIMESLFSITASTAAILAGITITPAGIISPLVAGYILNRFNMNVTQIFKLCIGALVAGGIVALGFLFTTCPDDDFAGVTTVYGNSSLYYDDGLFNLTASCNTNCNCEDVYDPVCGSDGTMYYSACHAGCTVESELENPTTYRECACIPPPTSSNSTYGTAQSGKCTSNCSSLIPFLIVAFGIFLFSYVVPVLTLTVTLRCVDFSQRSFALGVQSLFNKCLGSVPGPIVFGALVDKACRLWEYQCDGSGNCWLYSNSDVTFYLVIMICAFRVGTIIFFTCALLTYKPPKEQLYAKEEDARQNNRTDKMELT